MSKLITEEIIAVLPSHSQFRPKNNLYLDLHGLVFETSIYHWQDQPGSVWSIAAVIEAGQFHKETDPTETHTTHNTLIVPKLQ